MGAAFNEGGDQGAMHTYAYCDKRPLGLEKRSRSTTVDGSMGTGSVTARCPKGQEAYSGGFANPDFGNDPGDPRIVPFESRRIGRRAWRVSAGNFGDPGTLTAFAYCKA